MPARHNHIRRALCRLPNIALLRSYNPFGRLPQPDVRFATKASHWAPTSSKHLVNLPVHLHSPMENTTDLDFKQHCISTKNPAPGSSSTSNSNMLYVNTRDILTVDWQRRSVQQAVHDVQHLIQQCEEDIEESERRIADLSCQESKLDRQGTFGVGNSIKEDNEGDSFHQKGSEPRVNGLLDTQGVCNQKANEVGTGLVLNARRLAEND